MTNKEKYKQAFDTLSTSDNFSLEVDKMSILNRKHKLKTIAATVATCLISRNRNSLRFRSWRNSAESPALDPRRSDNCHFKDQF